MSRIPLLAAPLLAALLHPFGGAALAQPGLTASTPAAGTTVTAVRSLSLRFSETLIEDGSGIDLVMTGMPGMAHHQPMKISGFATHLAPDGMGLAITLPRALPAGSYQLRWHVVTTGKERAQGDYSFTVK